MNTNCVQIEKYKNLQKSQNVLIAFTAILSLLVLIKGGILIRLYIKNRRNQNNQANKKIQFQYGVDSPLNYKDKKQFLSGVETHSAAQQKEVENKEYKSNLSNKKKQISCKQNQNIENDTENIQYYKACAKQNKEDDNMFITEQDIKIDLDLIGEMHGLQGNEYQFENEKNFQLYKSFVQKLKLQYDQLQEKYNMLIIDNRINCDYLQNQIEELENQRDIQQINHRNEIGRLNQENDKQKQLQNQLKQTQNLSDKLTLQDQEIEQLQAQIVEKQKQINFQEIIITDLKNQQKQLQEGKADGDISDKRVKQNKQEEFNIKIHSHNNSQKQIDLYLFDKGSVQNQAASKKNKEKRFTNIEFANIQYVDKNRKVQSLSEIDLAYSNVINNKYETQPNQEMSNVDQSTNVYFSPKQSQIEKQLSEQQIFLMSNSSQFKQLSSQQDGLENESKIPLVKEKILIKQNQKFDKFFNNAQVKNNKNESSNLDQNESLQDLFQNMIQTCEQQSISNPRSDKYTNTQEYQQEVIVNNELIGHQNDKHTRSKFQSQCQESSTSQKNIVQTQKTHEKRNLTMF